MNYKILFCLVFLSCSITKNLKYDVSPKRDISNLNHSICLAKPVLLDPKNKSNIIGATEIGQEFISSHNLEIFLENSLISEFKNQYISLDCNPESIHLEILVNHFYLTRNFGPDLYLFMNFNDDFIFHFTVILRKGNEKKISNFLYKANQNNTIILPRLTNLFPWTNDPFLEIINKLLQSALPDMILSLKKEVQNE